LLQGLLDHLLSPLWGSAVNLRELKMTGPRRLALQGWIVIGLLVLILLGIVGLGVEIKVLPYLWRGDAPSGDVER
jgi:hypothetical protein